MRTLIPIDLSSLNIDVVKDIPIILNGNAIGVVLDNKKGCLWLYVFPEYILETDNNDKIKSAKISALNIQTKEYECIWSIRE